MKNNISSRRLARTALIQSIYQQRQLEKDLLPHQVVEILKLNQVGKILPDSDFFYQVYEQLKGNQPMIRALITEHLSDQWSYDRLPLVLQGILESACCEILCDQTVPIPVIIDEYLEITKSFSFDQEIPFVHSLLDRVAQKKSEIADVA